MELRASFRKAGVIRTPRVLSPSTTHRGYEIRFSALSPEERDRIIELLLILDFTPGAPFAKGRGFRIPVYGLEQTLRLSALLGEVEYFESLNATLENPL